MLAAACAPASTHCPHAGDWASLVLAHQSRYPAMQLDDAYKLLHQATMGSEHAVTDRGGPAAWMEREWSEMGDGPAEPLVDTLGASGRFARVHLRPLRELGGSRDTLVDLFVETAQAASPDTSELACALGALDSLARTGSVPWQAAAVGQLISDRRRDGFPAVHHSQQYEASARPAYRVVSLALIPRLLQASQR